LEENVFVEDEGLANALEEGQEAEAFIGSSATFLKLDFGWRPKTYVLELEVDLKHRSPDYMYRFW
jgi:hypothetical protein